MFLSVYILQWKIWATDRIRTRISRIHLWIFFTEVWVYTQMFPWIYSHISCTLYLLYKNQSWKHIETCILYSWLHVIICFIFNKVSLLMENWKFKKSTDHLFKIHGQIACSNIDIFFFNLNMFKYRYHIILPCNPVNRPLKNILRCLEKFSEIFSSQSKMADYNVKSEGYTRLRSQFPGTS